MIIDAHTHVWPDAVAHRALSANGTGFDHVGDGTLAGLRASMAASGVDRSIVLGVANDAAAVEKVCRFSASVSAADVVGLGAVHVDLPVEDNLRHLRDNRLVGIKVHPLYQGFGLDDRRLLERMDALEPGMLAVVHVGTGGDGRPVAGSTPALLRDLALAVPHVHVVACHFGGYHHLDEAFEVICGSGIVVDTSWPPSLGRVDPERVRDFVRRHGADKVVFASDWPTADPAREIEVIGDLGLGADETEQVLGLTMHELLAPVEARVAAQPR